jgi:small subunit ribosomal protein S9
MVKKKDKPSFAVGKRKTAIARASIKLGTGKIRVNFKPLELWGNEPVRLWIKEPLILSGELGKTVDIDINVRGGGISGQGEAVRQAIAKSLVGFSGDKELKNKYLEYDRNLLVYDFRRTEPHQPSASKRGSRRHKQRSKR